MMYRTLFFMVMACLLVACQVSTTGAPASATAPKPDTQPDPAKPIKIVIVGDSTVANYATNIPDRGWGQFFGESFNNSVTAVNTAKNGRSTKTFITEGLWKKALEEKPAYVLIQFGHNDSHAATNPESTNAATDFRTYLRQYIDESRAIGAIPILVTPVQRRTYDAQGALDNSLLPYADAMKVVAKEKEVGLIDLNKTSGELYNRLGKDKANTAVSRNGTDATHFNERGARWMCTLVIRDLLELRPELKARLKEGVTIPKEIDLSTYKP